MLRCLDVAYSVYCREYSRHSKACQLKLTIAIA
jgi:hypothetical protein